MMMAVPGNEWEQRLWLEQRASEVLQHVPIRSGDTVLDFGCGAGNYAIPAAELIGEKGVVYALDCDSACLARLQARAAEAGACGIHVITGDGGVQVPLEDGSCDVVLLYDVLQKIDNRKGLLAELRRVLRPGGVLSVYPMHLNPDEVRAAVEAASFRLRDDFAGLVFNFVRE